MYLFEWWELAWGYEPTPDLPFIIKRRAQ